MPFGICCASDIAQNMVEDHFGDIGVLPVHDDLIIAGKDEAEHMSFYDKSLSVHEQATSSSIGTKSNTTWNCIALHNLNIFSSTGCFPESLVSAN